MTEREEDLLLRRALLDALRLDWEEVLEAAPPAAPSPRQKRRLGAMLADPAGYARRAARPLWKTAARTAAAVFLACALTLGSLLAASPTIRAAVMEWMREVYETFTVYRFAGEQTTNEMPRYEIGDLPEGYADTGEIIEGPMSRTVYYENSVGQRMNLGYMRMEQGGAVAIGTEDMTIKEVTVNGCSGQIYISMDGSTSNGILWIDEEKKMVFTVDGFVDEISLLHIAESVVLEESTN